MSAKPAGPVAIVGLGHSGGGMAARLLSQGWAVQVCDVDPATTSAWAELAHAAIFKQLQKPR